MKLLFLILPFFMLNCISEKRQSDYQAQKVLHIDLGEKLSSKELQISGLDWHGDDLILLPQFPEDFGGNAFSIPKADIIRYVNGDTSPLNISEISFIENGIREKITNPEYEAIAFTGDTAYLLTEKERPMESYIVRAKLDSKNVLNIEPDKAKKIPIPFDTFEMGCESIVLIDDTIHVFYEANGSNINSSPQVFRFDLDLNPLQSLALPNIEFRITDATRVDDANSFWVINNFWQGEERKLKPAEDEFIPNIFNKREDGIKRLLHLELKDNEIIIADTYPLMLESEEWNWEGLVKLDDIGFLIINDEYSPKPEKTTLGFIPLNK